MTVVGVTGISGSLGRQLLMQLEVDPDVTAVVGLDLVPPPDPGLKLSFHQRDVSQPFGDLFRQHGVQIAIHLAATADPDRAREEATNLAGTRHFLAACHEAGAKVLCVVSSALAYGAREGPVEVLYEGAPLRPERAPTFVRDKVAMEDLCYEYVKTHPDACLQIVRPCLIVGPNADNFLTRLLCSRVVLAPLGQDAPLQLIHEDDATRAIYRLVKTEKVGVFNLAGDGVLTLGQMARLAEKRVVRLPLWLLRLCAWLGWRLGLRAFPRLAPGLWAYLRHACLVAPIKLRNETGLLFRYDTAQAFLDWLEVRSGGALPRQMGGWHVLDEDLEDLEDEDLLPPEAAEPPPAPAPAEQAPAEQAPAEQAQPVAPEVTAPGWGDTARPADEGGGGEVVVEVREETGTGTEAEAEAEAEGEAELEGEAASASAAPATEANRPDPA